MLGKIVDVCKTCRGGGGMAIHFIYFIVFGYIFEECVEVVIQIAENLRNNRNNYYYVQLNVFTN